MGNWKSKTHTYDSLGNIVMVKEGTVKRWIIQIKHGYFGNHSLAVYGYELYTDPFNSQAKFLKVRDGWAQVNNTQKNRYVCMNTTGLVGATTIHP